MAAMATNGGTKALVAVLAADLTIAVLRFVAYFLTLSSSMLVEASRSLAASGNQVLLLVGGKRATQPPARSIPLVMGASEELLVAAKISLGSAEIGRDIAAAIDDAESRIRTAAPMARLIYLEPDLHHEDGQHRGPVPGEGQVSDAARISAEAGPQDTKA